MPRTHQCGASKSTTDGGGRTFAVALRKFHVGERFLLRQFTPHSVPRAYRRKWKELNGGTHHANLSENSCDSGRCRRNRRWQCGSSRSLVRLLPDLRVLPVLPSSLLSPSLLRLLPLLPSSLLPPLLAPLVLARSFFQDCICGGERLSCWRQRRVRLFANVVAIRRVSSRMSSLAAATSASSCATSTR